MPCAFVDNYKIDSYLKLRMLLALHAQPQRRVSLDELSEQFFISDCCALEQLVTDLGRRGLLQCDAAGWRRSDQAAVIDCLCCLERTFDDPWARQRLLNQIAGRDADPVN
jgi:hypothetical protein